MSAHRLEHKCFCPACYGLLFKTYASQDQVQAMYARPMNEWRSQTRHVAAAASGIPGGRSARGRALHRAHTCRCIGPCTGHAHTWQHRGGCRGGRWTPHGTVCCMHARTAGFCRTSAHKADACSCCVGQLKHCLTQPDLQQQLRG